MLVWSILLFLKFCLGSVVVYFGQICLFYFICLSLASQD